MPESTGPTVPGLAPIPLVLDLGRGRSMTVERWSEAGCVSPPGLHRPPAQARLRLTFQELTIIREVGLTPEAGGRVLRFTGLGTEGRRMLALLRTEAETGRQATLDDLIQEPPAPPAKGGGARLSIALLVAAAVVVAAFSVEPESPPLPPIAAGADVTVDGIASRPDYGFSPGPAFFAPEAVEDEDARVFSAEAFGAVPDPAVDNRAAIQAAIDAAHAAGGGVVRLGEGTFGLAGHIGGYGSLKLRDNTFLKGAGMGRTVLRVIDGWSGTITGIVRTPWGEATKNYGLADLTLDGNRANTTGKVDAYYSGGKPGGTITDEDAWVLRVEARNNSGYGFDPHERTERLMIADCTAHGNGMDGFVADYIIDGVYRDNRAWNNDRHGFNLVTTTNDFLLTGGEAKNNGGDGVVVQRGSFPIPSPSNLVIEDMVLHGNGRSGVLVRLSENVELRRLDIRGNGTYGVRVLGSSRVTLRDSTILDNSASRARGFSAVQIRDEGDDVMQRVYPALGTLIVNSRIGWTPLSSGRHAVEEQPGEVGDTAVVGSRLTGRMRAPLALVGEASTARASPAGTLGMLRYRVGELVRRAGALAYSWIDSR